MTTNSSKDKEAILIKQLDELVHPISSSHVPNTILLINPPRIKVSMNNDESEAWFSLELPFEGDADEAFNSALAALRKQTAKFNAETKSPQQPPQTPKTEATPKNRIDLNQLLWKKAENYPWESIPASACKELAEGLQHNKYDSQRFAHQRNDGYSYWLYPLKPKQDQTQYIQRIKRKD